MATVACSQKTSATWQEYVKIMGRRGFLILWGKKRSGRRVSTREMEEEMINIVTFMALFLF